METEMIILPLSTIQLILNVILGLVAVFAAYKSFSPSEKTKKLAENNSVLLTKDNARLTKLEEEKKDCEERLEELNSDFSIITKAIQALLQAQIYGNHKADLEKSLHELTNILHDRNRKK